MAATVPRKRYFPAVDDGRREEDGSERNRCDRSELRTEVRGWGKLGCSRFRDLPGHRWINIDGVDAATDGSG